MLIDVTTMEGHLLSIDAGEVMLLGPVTEEGAPMVGVTRVVLKTGAAMVVRAAHQTLKEEINAALAGSPRIALA